MFSYEIISLPQFEYNKHSVSQIFEEIEKTIPSFQKGTLNLVFVSGEEIQKLNKTYREKDSITDVLSFHYFEDFSGLNQDDIAGEIIFCEEKIISQGQEYGLGSEYEFYKLLIHSVLHILGYDHESDEEYEVMQKYEEKIAENIFGKKFI